MSSEVPDQNKPEPSQETSSAPWWRRGKTLAITVVMAAVLGAAGEVGAKLVDLLFS
ncbi:hypothetical protein ACIHAX_36085 [Nocardia sp. NPDC051929]|uniref:hypothetical protein n=1 Tax=Nocardia sp. NPDC051929 TaxID=3364327 RepID=UPI0037C81361